jgi:hypothetical protein
MDNAAKAPLIARSTFPLAWASRSVNIIATLELPDESCHRITPGAAEEAIGATSPGFHSWLR